MMSVPLIRGLPFEQTESHFKERIAHYESLSEKFPETSFFAKQAENYKRWLDNFLAAKPLSSCLDSLPF